MNILIIEKYRYDIFLFKKYTILLFLVYNWYREVWIMFDQRYKSDIIGKCKLNDIENRLDNIISNCLGAEECFISLIETYFDIAEYTGMAIKYYCKTGYSTLEEGYGYNDICKFDEYAKECYARSLKMKEIIDIKFGSIMQVEEIHNLFEAMNERISKNEFGIPKDFFQREFKKNLLIEGVSTYIQIYKNQEVDSNYKYDDEEKYNLLMDMYHAYTEEPNVYFYRGIIPQFEKEIAGVLRLINNKSIFRGKVFEKKK